MSLLVLFGGASLPEITGAVNVTLEDATIAATGTVYSAIEGALAITLEDATIEATGTVGSLFEPPPEFGFNRSGGRGGGRIGGRAGRR